MATGKGFMVASASRWGCVAFVCVSIANIVTCYQYIGNRVSPQCWLGREPLSWCHRDILTANTPLVPSKYTIQTFEIESLRQLVVSVDCPTFALYFYQSIALIFAFLRAYQPYELTNMPPCPIPPAPEAGQTTLDFSRHSISLKKPGKCAKTWTRVPLRRSTGGEQWNGDEFDLDEDVEDFEMV